ncbi:MAG: choice-of-anchor Q domain-containing protein [Ferruginibacter sp.]
MKKHLQILCSAYLRMVFIVFGFCCSNSYAATRYVKTGSAGTAPYTTWATASNDLQAVINQCVAGDEIWIAAGTYKPNRRADALTVITATNRNNAFVLKSGVRVYGGFTGTETLLNQRDYDANVVILSGDIGTAGVTTDNCYHVVINAGTNSSTSLQGVTIQEGNANGTLVITPSITVNGYSINPRRGGGVFNIDVQSGVSDVIIKRNNAAALGGGMYDSASVYTFAHGYFTITQNTSDDGAGLYVSGSDFTLFEAIFSNNVASGEGGGIFITPASITEYYRCEFTGNQAVSNGGGFSNYSNHTSLTTHCLFSGNESGGSGGGMFNNNSSTINILNCVFSGNAADAGGAIWNSFSDANIIQTTIAGNYSINQGGGIGTGSSAIDILNSIIYGNAAGTAGTNAVYNSASTINITYSAIQGGYAGTGNTAGNPLFVNAQPATSAPTTAGDYQIQKCGAAVNGGNNSFTAGISNDFLYNTRINYGTVDMGAYELQLTLAVPDANGIVYVDYTKAGNGNSWVNAVTELADALVAAKYNTSIQQIWVAKGTYKPKYSPVNNSLYCLNTNRDNAFVLVKDVKLIGGFAGGEADTAGRNFVTNETILSGDLATPASTDNCYHILISAGNIGTALVNGFSITGGMANSTGNVTVNSINIERQNGAAIFNASSAGLLTVELCNIHHNTANVEAGGFFSRAVSVAVIKTCSFTSNSVSNTGNGGAAIYNETNTNVTVSNCSFTSNTSITSTPGYGGAILNSVASIANISNSVFIANQANIGGAIHNNTCTAIITGCTFTNNSSAGNGGAISNNQTVIGSSVTDCVFSGNTAVSGGGGGAIYNSNAKLTIKNSSITNNQANATGGGMYNTGGSADIKIYDSHIDENITSSVGGGIYNLSGDLLMDKCTVSGNTAAATSGIYANGSTIFLYNSLLSGNKSNNDRPALHLEGSTGTVINSTIAGNKKQSGTTGSGIVIDGASPSLTLHNSVVWGNQGTVAGALPILVSTGTATVTYSLIEGGFAGAGNLNSDPLFISPQAVTAAPTAAGNYRLQKCSPAINTGSNPLIPAGVTKDLDNSNRTAFTTVDMGAYEKVLAVPSAAGIVYVNSSNTTNEGDGSSWAKAITQLGDALKAAKFNTDIQQIWVAKGMYKPIWRADFTTNNITDCPNLTDRDNAFVTVNNVKMIGGFAGGETDTAGRNLVINETILSGDVGIINTTSDNCYHILISAGSVNSAECNGFSITRGNANGSGNITVNTQTITRNFGAGIYSRNSSPYLTSCSVKNNIAISAAGQYNLSSFSTITGCTYSSNSNSTGQGGGMYNENSSPAISYCVFSSNLALNTGGGGMLNTNSSPVISNCSFLDNECHNFVNGGGGMRNVSASSPVITNCLFSGNIGFVGGIMNSNSSPTIDKCTFRENSSPIDVGGGIGNFSSSSIITNCSFLANSAAEGGGAICNAGTSSPVIANCIFSGNVTTKSGGAIFNYCTAAGSPLITNCTFGGNRASINGGAFNIMTTSPYNLASYIIKNCVFWGNGAAAGNEIYPVTGQVQPSNCIIQGGYTGGSNIEDVNPLFIAPQPAAAAPTLTGDYRLQSCSPALNIGDNTAIPAGITLDLDKNTRIAYTDVDLGAYEQQTNEYIDGKYTTWKGVNTNWHNKINWCGGFIPTAAIDATIPAALTNYPVLSAPGSTKNITLNNGSSITTDAAGHLIINGIYTNNGCTISNNGSWVMAGNAASQTFPGTNATVNAMNNLEINNPGGIAFDKSFELTGTLSPTSGNINVNNNVLITLNSDATSTARVATVQSGSSFSYTGTGQFAIERYIPAKRSWRLLTAPVSTASSLSINQAWQEGLSNANRLSPINLYPGFGTTITKSTAYNPSDGYDQGSTNNPSIRYYNGVNWGGVPSATNGTTAGANNGLINDQQGYMLFVRGNRDIQVASTSVTPTNTTLRPKGQLKTGPQLITCNGWTVIGNPYASSINFHKIAANNPGLPDIFYLWDPNLAGSQNFGVGGWVSYGAYNIGSSSYTISPSASTANTAGDIPSGSAFMVNYTGTITINETDKTTGINNALFRPSKQINANLYVHNTAESPTLTDGATIVFNESDTAEGNDVLKNKNFNENFGIQRNEKVFAIESRKILNENDSVVFYMKQMQAKKYTLEITMHDLQLPGNLVPLLRDEYFQTVSSLKVQDTNRYDFIYSADAGALVNRFKLLFKKTILLSNITTTNVENNINVQWQAENEWNIKEYVIERSVNGIDFYRTGTTAANQNGQTQNNYAWPDNDLPAGEYYYRIKCITQNGVPVYSNIAKAAVVNSRPGIYIYPNPVTGADLQLRINKMPAGYYSAIITTASGQVVCSEKWTHTGNDVTIKIILPGIRANGTYQLKITQPGNKQIILPVQLQ